MAQASAPSPSRRQAQGRVLVPGQGPGPMPGKSPHTTDYGTPACLFHPGQLSAARPDRASMASSDYPQAQLPHLCNRDAYQMPPA